jgi:hypothetical protein
MLKLNYKSLTIVLSALISCSSYAGSSVQTNVNLTNNSTTPYYATDGSHTGDPVNYQQTLKEFKESTSSTDRQCWLGDTASATYTIYINKYNDPALHTACVVTLHISYCDNFGNLSITKNSYVNVGNEPNSADSCTASWKHSNNPGSLNITVNPK